MISLNNKCLALKLYYYVESSTFLWRYKILDQSTDYPEYDGFIMATMLISRSLSKYPFKATCVLDPQTRHAIPSPAHMLKI